MAGRSGSGRPNPLREITPEVTESSAHLFTVPRGISRWAAVSVAVSASPNSRSSAPPMCEFPARGSRSTIPSKPTGPWQPPSNAGTNPPKGVVVTYYLKQKPDGRSRSRSWTRRARRSNSSAASPAEEPARRCPPQPETNQFVWNMDYPNARQLPSGGFASSNGRTPGRRWPLRDTPQVRLSVGGQDSDQNFVIREDPRVEASQQDLQAEFDLTIKIRDEIQRRHRHGQQVRTRSRPGGCGERSRRRGGRGCRSSGENWMRRLFGVETNLVRMIDPSRSVIVPPKR